MLDYACFLECSIRPILIDGLDCAGRDGKYESLFELRYIDTLLLEINLSAYFTSRVVLGCTSGITIATP
ncbi:MAG: hypothetical protein RLZZ347_540 [Candidatus Parcubacteria bacterium]|jgi:hypothetical protein